MKLWQKLALGILIILLAAMAYFFWPEGTWPFVPRLGDLANTGEPYQVRILRDSYGVPHIFGERDADVAYGLAYAHAEDDFRTIQQALLAARGRLATVYGRDAAANDYMVQLLRIWDVVDANYESDLQPETKAILTAYAAGLNQYAALHPDEVISSAMFPVTDRDVVAGFVHKTPLFYGIDGVLTELFAGERQRPVSDAPVPASLSLASPLITPNFQSPILNRQSSSPHGSNTFAVAPGRSANGSTFLAVNSHQPWAGAVTWYEAHLHSEDGWNAVGGLFPGAPTILHGHNEALGWAFTVNSPDLVDVYVLEINPDNENQYRFDGEWRELEVREAPISVRLFGRFRWTVREEVLWSVYGPTVRRPHGTYALRFAGYGEVGLVEQWYRMNRATSLAEWLDAMQDGPLPMFNAGYADKEGNILYLYNGLLPLRASGYDWEGYLPGDTSATLWTDYLPFAELPRVLNPVSGFIQNGNSSPFETTAGGDNPDPDAYADAFGIERDMSNRALRALDLFGADDSISAAEFVTYKFDSRYAEESGLAAIVETLRNAPPPVDPDLQTAQTLLQGWDLRSDTDSEGATVAILLGLFVDEREDVDFSTGRGSEADITEEILWEELGNVVAHLQEHFGRIAVPWGEVNRLRRGDVDLPLGGAPDVLHAIYGEFDADGRLRGVAGDSYVLLITWDANRAVSSRSIHQFGSATLDASSPHYADQAPLFAQRQLKPVWFTEADIRANLEQEYAPGAEQR